MINRVLRLHAVLELRGRSRSSHYTDIKTGLFVKPVLIGLRAVGWPSSEAIVINAAQIAGKSNQEIRTLVSQLETVRKTVINCMSQNR